MSANEEQHRALTNSAARDRFRSALPYEPGQSREFYHQRTAVFYWGCADDLLDVELWGQGDGHCAGVFGYGITRHSGQLLDARAVAAADSFDALWDGVDGEWSALSVRDGRVVAGSSAVGTEHVYYTQANGVIAISNRARPLWFVRAALGASLTPDFSNLSQLLTLCNPFCTSGTAVRDVKLLASTSFLEVDALEHRLSVEPLDPVYFLAPGDSRNAPDWDGLTRQFCDNFGWLGDHETTSIAALTGGKDSRLVLAALLDSGFHERIDHFYIRAPDNHADVIVAKRLAEAFELNFRRLDRPPKNELFDELESHVRFTEGMLNAWDIKTELPDSPYVGIHGLIGELYRRQGSAGYSSAEQWANHFAGDSKDLGGLVDPGMRARHRDAVKNWLEMLADHGVDLSEFAADVFYLRQRIPRWMGQAKLNDGLWGVHFNPLFHRDLLRAYYRLPVQDRADERVHFELMARLAPELVEMPFAQASWNRKMIRRSTRPSVQSAPEGIGHRGKIIGTGWQVPALRACWSEARQRAISASEMSNGVISGDRVHALFDVAAVLLGQESSIRQKSRVALSHPKLLFRCSRDESGMVRRILGLLTIDALCADLRNLRPILRERFGED